MDQIPWIAELSKKTDIAKTKLPEALSKQKKKFLIALNKNSELDFSEEDETFVKKVMQDLDPLAGLKFNYLSLQWNDTKAVNNLNHTIEKHALFELLKYLNCTKIVLLTYSGTSVAQYSEAAEYVLTHARQLGDMSKTIFQVDVEPAPQINIEFVSSPLPNSKFMNKMANLIEDLRNAYDETKYMTLNANTTYITLLMLRRRVKNEAEFSQALKRIQTHDTYVKLCPWPLDNQLPKCDTSKLVTDTLTRCIFLAVQAYLNTQDEETKRVLRVTCVQYMEWNGLQLPNLFFKVAELYKIEAGTLWDLLTSDKTAASLVCLANEYFLKYQILKQDPAATQLWFPFCRVLLSEYHRDLSAPENVIICLILAYLVDLKIGFDESTVRLSHWAKSNLLWNEPCKNFATKIYNKLNA